MEDWKICASLLLSKCAADKFETKLSLILKLFSKYARSPVKTVLTGNWVSSGTSKMEVSISS